MFDFLKKKKEEKSSNTLYVSPDILSKEKQQLIELLDGKESYKRFFWVLHLKMVRF